MAKTGIYQRKKTWWIRYTVDGVQKFESSGSRHYKDAVALLTRRQNEILEGKRPEVVRIGNHLFRELAEKYDLHCQGERGYRSKRSIIKFLKAEFGNLPLKNFSKSVVKGYQDKLKAQGLAASTNNRRISTLKHMFSMASLSDTEWRMVGKSVKEDVHAVRMLRENKRVRFLSLEEIDRLLAACGTEKHQEHGSPFHHRAMNLLLSPSSSHASSSRQKAL